PSGYTANVALDNPVAYWRLGEPGGSTTVLDRSGHGTTGTLNGTVTLGIQGGLGNDTDTAARFDGSTGYITTPAIGALPRWPVEAWINPAGNQSTDASVISDVYSTLFNYLLYFNSTGRSPLRLLSGFFVVAVWHSTMTVIVLRHVLSLVAVTSLVC